MSTGARSAGSLGASPTSCLWLSTRRGRRSCSCRPRRRPRVRSARGALSIPGCGPRSWRPAARSRSSSRAGTRTAWRRCGRCSTGGRSRRRRSRLYTKLDALSAEIASLRRAAARLDPTVLETHGGLSGVLGRLCVLEEARERIGRRGRRSPAAGRGARCACRHECAGRRGVPRWPPTGPGRMPGGCPPQLQPAPAPGYSVRPMVYPVSRHPNLWGRVPAAREESPPNSAPFRVVERVPCTRNGKAGPYGLP